MAIGFKISELKLLSEELRKKLGLPFDEMTHSFFKRRLSQFVEANGIRKVEQLLEQLNDKIFADQFIHFFSVNTTELFRDAGFWRHLRKMFLEKYSDRSINIWLPDGASGEELYSLIILIDELKLTNQVKITVNHSSAAGLKMIQSGVLLSRKLDVNAYNYKRFEGIGSLDNYFSDTVNGFAFKIEQYNNITFIQGGIEKVPAAKSDIIIMRNALLYYSKDYHTTVKLALDQSLKNGGLLCLGVKELLASPYNDRFECIDSKEKIYSKFSFLRDE
ncbi:CheR family methyltransferase [Carboxylicivirga marina]|uniref:CheR family methyltransferase n=1 Tax=Carboxylicivirga marina TaxID=2800988 RepID=UPI0025917DBC|nr:CheR family methyltransferase [uncultured Carboxylicivirga sp.]